VRTLHGQGCRARSTRAHSMCALCVQEPRGPAPEEVQHGAGRAGAQAQRLAHGHEQREQAGRVGRVRVHQLHRPRAQLALLAAHPHLGPRQAGRQPCPRGSPAARSGRRQAQACVLLPTVVRQVSAFAHNQDA